MQQQPPMGTSMETMVREYKSSSAYQRDAAHLAQQGWTVANTVERQPRTGCLRGCLLGLMALVWRPKPILIVTYQRMRR